MRIVPALSSSSLVLALASVMAFVAACPTTVTTAKPAAVAAPAAVTVGKVAAKTGCDQASLAVDGSTVVATVNGKNVTYADLGPEVVAGEQKALRDYCKAVHELRSRALENAVIENLLSKDAKAANKTVDEYVKSVVDAAMNAEPTDVELTAFYESHKREGMPSFEELKPQVVLAVKQEKAKGAIGNLIDSAKKGADVKRQLPDVRPAPVDLSPAVHTFVAGKKDAKVQVVEFADFECPYCSTAASTMSQLKKKYGDRVSFSFRHFPLSFHPNAQKASEYAQCAGEQGKFWEMHDLIFANQSSLTESDLKGHIKTLALDDVKLSGCLSSGKGTREVASDLALGGTAGVQGTPSFFINGYQHAGAPSPEALSEAIDAALSGS
ncbi:MAG: thioredoxin domain-containing protein [Deltaproteobacteria bacterium]|nr:thioredoxin domain-containing protein [Deltaproteobacteria bacterium]